MGLPLNEAAKGEICLKPEAFSAALREAMKEHGATAFSSELHTMKTSAAWAFLCKRYIEQLPAQEASKDLSSLAQNW